MCYDDSNKTFLPCHTPQLVQVSQAVHDEAGVPSPLHLTLLGQAGLGVGGGEGASSRVGGAATRDHAAKEDKANDDLEHEENTQACEVNVENIFTDRSSPQEIYGALKKRNL